MPTRYIFALGDTASLTAWTLYNRQQANFGTCYVVARAYSLEQQNAGRTHAWLCHASSAFFFLLSFFFFLDALSLRSLDESQPNVETYSLAV